MSKCKRPQKPQDLLEHRLLAFSFWTPTKTWSFVHTNGRKKETLTFQPFLAMNDYAGLATALLAGTGIGDLPPLVQRSCCATGALLRSCRDGTSPSLISGWSTWAIGTSHGPCACLRNSRPKWLRRFFLHFRPEWNLRCGEGCPSSRCRSLIPYRPTGRRLEQRAHDLAAKHRRRPAD
jgi:hypothetical protein